MVIPEIALAPDISGVCKVGGTLEISSNPIKQARTKMNRENMSMDIVRILNNEQGIMKVELPYIALAPDIKGVCKVGGTFEINSKPIKQARTKMNKEKMSMDILNELGIFELGICSLFLIRNSIILN